MKIADFQNIAASKIKNTAKGLKIIFSGLLFALIFAGTFSNLNAQETVDKTVATVSVGRRSSAITYSNLLWQLALDPDAPLNPPVSPDLKRALQLIINQRVIGLRLPAGSLCAPTAKEIDDEIKRVAAFFPSTAEFEKRLQLVGFDSIRDRNFEQMIELRVQIEKYLEIGFRSRMVISPEDEAKYYREVFAPDFRRRNPGLLLPTLDEMRSQINRILTEKKMTGDLEKYLEEAKGRAEIVILSDI